MSIRMNIPINIPGKPGGNAGFTLIEIMVTMVVMSIGLLGLAGLQATALRSNSGATFQTHVVLYANEMAERIQANPDGVTANSFLNITSATIDCGALPNPYCEEYYDEGSGAVIAAESCNSTELAAFDINTWFCGIARATNDPGNRGAGITTQLSSASAAIVCTDSDAASGTPDADACSPNSTHTISINWRTLKEKGTDFTDSGECLNTGDDATDCQSLRLVIKP